MPEINSKSNQTFKMLCSLRTKKGRSEHGLYTVEGLKSVSEALECAASVTLLAATPSVLQANAQITTLAKENKVPICTLTDTLFQKISDTQTPPGILAVIEPNRDAAFTCSGGLYIYCDRLADPGNAGTIIRTADAVGASGVAFSPDAVDLYNPKVIRATMGSFFHIKTFTDVRADALLAAKQSGYSLIAATLSPAAADCRSMQLPRNTVLVIGNESNGVSKPILELCDRQVSIPIVGKAESLNAAMAAGILMYKWLFELE